MLHRPILIMCMPLAACGPDASHVPNPLVLPLHAVSSTLHNARYDARRRPVETHVAAHHATIVSEITQGGGPQLGQAMDLAGVAGAKRANLLARLGQDIALYRADADALVVALMVHGG